GPSQTTRLIGRRCKRGNALSRPVLIGRGLDFRCSRSLSSSSGDRLRNAHALGTNVRRNGRPCRSSPSVDSTQEQGGGTTVSVAIAEGRHPVPFRTRKLSPPAPMVLPW